jgi:membrane-associated phospholipid phosphatase
MNPPDLFQTRWRWPRILACNLLALAILASWLWQPTRQLWDQFDQYAFHALNQPLSTNAFWARFWAIANMRYADIGVAVITFSILIKTDRVFDGTRIRSAFYGFLSLLLLLFLLRIGPVRETLIVIDWHRASPSLVFDDAVRLTRMFPEWEQHWHLKDSSKDCFPGDHGAVLLLWAMFLWSFASARKRLLIAVLTVTFMLPRLFSGAHWVSDDLVGGLSLSLVTMGLGFYTPYVARMTPMLARMGNPVLRQIEKIPGLNRISLISGR